MSKILVKTRGESSPQGKPRVYFSAHHDDYRAFFEPVSDEILKLQNCAIYYDEEPQQPYDEEELFLSLSQMQLFVMPVTTRLLTTPSRAIDVEFKYAIEHHIPVLPLMQEGGLEELFNKKCGDLQFLTKERKDMTELPYEEKLEKYLSSILIGDELAKKVRDAFDAYIFLSYRKKDRKYAQELMRLIHKNEFCRDIAIWYDEFLTPGENFNDAIGEALNKSSLFALAVTPNLVNEKNYVMTTEYPMAKKAEKSILPVEMVQTDRRELEKNYDGIPSCTKGDDEAGLSKSLTKLLHDIAIKDNDDDAQHNFFIGLAYFGGIDVEVDHERAVKLITFAAEKGLPEAIEKLVSMYRSGEGVERNYYTAVKWQRKLVEVRKDEFEKEQSEDNAFTYVNAIEDLGDYIYELRNIAEAKRIYIQMLDVCMALDREFDSSFTKICISASYSNLCNMCEAEGDIASAKGYCEKLLEIAKANVKKNNTIEAWGHLSSSYDRFGIMSYAIGDIITAKVCYTKAIDIKEIISKETGTVKARSNLWFSYIELGDICIAEGDIGSAKTYYEKSLEIAETIVTETETVESRCDLAHSYNRLGNMSEAEGDIATAQVYYAKTVKIRESIATETGTTKSRCDLAHSYISLGNISIATGNISAAKDYFAKSLGIAETIATETETVESRRDLSVSYNNLGDISLAEGDIAGAKVYYAKSLEIREALASETGTVGSYDDLAVSYFKLSFVCGEDEKRAYLEKALEIWEMLAANCPDVDVYVQCRDIVKEMLGIE